MLKLRIQRALSSFKCRVKVMWFCFAECLWLRVLSHLFPEVLEIPLSIWEFKYFGNHIFYYVLWCYFLQSFSIQLSSNIFSLWKIKVSEERDKVISLLRYKTTWSQRTLSCRAGHPLAWVAGHSTQQVYVSSSTHCGYNWLCSSSLFPTHSTHVAMQMDDLGLMSSDLCGDCFA